MKRARLKALVLAAGEGRRLRPLTQEIPKPLLPILGKPLICHTLQELAAVGCEAVAINLHHLGDRIRQHLGDSYAGLPLTYSQERELLGTLGALAPLGPFFAEADLVLIINGDSLCRWPLRRLLREHQRRRDAAATLLLSRRGEVERFAGGVGMDRDGRIRSFRRDEEGAQESQARYVFAGAHVVSRRWIERLEERPADFVQDLYRPLLDRDQALYGLVTGRRWHDLGTPRRYLEGALDAGRGWGPQRLWRRSWLSPSATVAPKARVRRSVLETNAQIAEGARVEGSLILSGARVEKGCVVKTSIVGPGVELPAGTWVERRVVVRQARGQRLERDDSLVGPLVFAPLREDPPGAPG